MNKHIYIAVFLISLFIAPDIFGGVSKEAVFEALREKIGDAEAVTVECENKKQSISAELRASKSGKYKLITMQRIIYCDGESIWNYSVFDRRMIVSDYENLGTVSLENLFFALLNDYKPKSISTTFTSSAGKVYKLNIVPKEENPDYPEVTLWLDRETKDIKKIYYDSSLGKETWDIKRIRLHETDDADYRFYPPERTRIIDLR